MDSKDANSSCNDDESSAETVTTEIVKKKDQESGDKANKTNAKKETDHAESSGGSDSLLQKKSQRTKSKELGGKSQNGGSEQLEESEKPGDDKDTSLKQNLFDDGITDDGVNDEVTSSSSSKKTEIDGEEEQEKMDTDFETTGVISVVGETSKSSGGSSLTNSDRAKSKDLTEEPDEVSEKMDVDEKHVQEESDVKDDDRKKNDSEVKKGKGRTRSEVKKDDIDVDMKSNEEINKKCTDDKTALKTDGTKENEKASTKEKSRGIDAIAKKLGQQVKVNEDNKHANEEEEKKKENVADNATEKPNHVSENATEDKEKESTKSESKSKSEGTEKKKSKKKCEECGVNKGLKFQVLFQGKKCYMCSDTCFKAFKSKQPTKKDSRPAAEPTDGPPPSEKCAQCKKTLKADKGYYPLVGEARPLCSEDCLMNYQEANALKKKCSQCKSVIEDETICLTWETMDFCNEDCLGKYQSYLGSHCTCCQAPVQQTSLGKYCVCFGADIRQFCSGACLEEFKKGLKVCSFCQKDLSSGSEGFLAPVGEKGQFKDFCSQQCMERYETMNNKDNTNSTTPTKCSFCNKSGNFRIKPNHNGTSAVLCGDNCVAGYRYLHRIKKKICDTCFRFFEPESETEFRLQYEGVVKFYCTKACMTLFVLSHRKIVPCSWCKVKKYNFDMIEKLDSSNQVQTYCSLNCISLYRVSLNATSAKSIRCDQCTKNTPAQYHLTMSDGSIRNFCTYQCVLQFQNQFTNVPALTTTSANRQTSSSSSSSSSSTSVTTTTTSVKTTATSHTPVISNVVSLAGSAPRPQTAILAPKLVAGPKIAAPPRQAVQTISLFSNAKPSSQTATIPTTPTSSSTTTTNASGTPVIREVIVKPPAPKSVKNKAVLCKPIMQTKGISCKPHPCHKAVQTDDAPTPAIIPIPVPVFVPTPVHMFSRPVPCPVPFPIPVPVPIFLPTTKDSPSQILKHLKDIQENLPSDPLEGEMLMMAEKAAECGDKKLGSSTESHFGEKDSRGEKQSIPETEDSSLFDVPLDVENEMPPGIAPVLSKEVVQEGDEDYVPKESRSHGKRSSKSKGASKRQRVERVELVSGEDSDSLSSMPLLEEHSLSSQSVQDTNLRLKHAFGVNAWKHWVLQKNSQLEKGSHTSRKFKLFKTDLLQLPPDELNYSLSLFVKEVRKPSGEEYAPASIYYLCLGIQQYLFENGRIDNIFTDPYYEKFTECLHDVLLSQDDILPVDGFFISRIEEEVLWESKQLGAHSPHVLLNTLMFFNTKYFNLKTIDEHLHLSFSHITKHWRKTSLKSGPRNTVLRYYPPVNKDWQRRRKEENGVYEQNENLENPLRCPVKLYEFYLSKCPESVKTRNDVFYLYPERSCVPDSPVWYSTQAMGRDLIARMLQRVKTVREVYEN